MTTSSASPGRERPDPEDDGGGAPARSADNTEGVQSLDGAIRVCVRFRPQTPEEVARHETEVWGKAGDRTVGIVGRFGITTKYAFDKVFGPEASNHEVYQAMISEVVDSVPEGINTTIFAYGVTSSGKTHTMHGTPGQPGIVKMAMQQLFHLVSSDQSRDFMIRLSYVEIYNEIINDLLDPARENLRVVDDALRGQVVEGATQQPVINAEEAMRLVEGGEVHRKVSATAANAGSSRSHTFVRVSVESSSSAAATGDEGGEDIVTRRLSSLNLIDLAGSEAAKVQQSRLQSREGSYINKSLLALGTVIAKLGDSNSKHIPFRDSKLTRLLASSLSGDGAKVCVICTATPTGSQAEETHNTLKFATRAKAVHVRVHRQETCNARELLIRYQQEVADLRQQLWRMRQSMGLEEPSAAPLPPEGGQAVALPGHRGGLEIASLEEVLSLRERLEEERAVRLKYEREREELQQQVDRLTAVHLEQVQAGEQRNLLVDAEVWRAQESLGLAGPGQAGDETHSTASEQGLQEVIPRQQMGSLAQELQERDRQIGDLRLRGKRLLADASELGEEDQRGNEGRTEAQAEADRELELRILHADRDALQQRLHSIMEENSKLRGMEAGACKRLQSMEEQVKQVVAELEAKEEQLASERDTLQRFRDLEKQVELQLCETSYDNSQLRKEVERLEAQNNHLQGYLLDGMSGSELSRLIRSLTQAVERVRVTVQMRRLTGPSPQLSPRSIPIIMLHEPQQPGLTPQEPQHRLGGGSLPPTPPASPRPPGKAKAETQCPTSSAVTSEARIAYHAPRDLVEKEMDNLQRVMPLRRPMTYSSRERQ